MPEKRKDSKGRVLRNGEVQRPDGKYMYRYTDIEGNRQTIYSWQLVKTDKVPDGKKCTAALRDMIKEIEKDLNDDIRTRDAEETTVNDLFEMFLDLRKDLRTTTRCNYSILYDANVRNTIGVRHIKNVKYSDIQKLYTGLAKSKNLKTSTLRSIHAILYQIFDMAVRDGMLRANPAENVFKNFAKLFKEEKKPRHALTKEEQSRLIDYVYSSRDYKKWAPLFTVLLGTGMRIGEALGLRWSDCDFKKGTISVNHSILYKLNEDGKYEYRISSTKTIAGMRSIPMFSDVKNALQELQKKAKKNPPPPFEVDGYKGFIFVNSQGKVFTPAYFYDVIQAITFAYNKEEFFHAEQEAREPCLLPKFSAHILRHTFCTRLCELESDLKIIQDIMGHQNIRTTMDVYNEATQERKQKSFKNIDGFMKLA